jgi:hypothetical protein
MFADLELIEKSNIRVREEVADTERIVKQHQQTIEHLTDKLRELLTTTAKLATVCERLEEEQARHEIALFAQTENNIFGSRGAHVELAEGKRFTNYLVKGLWVAGTTIAGLFGFIVWLWTTFKSL